ncbi:MAG: hypothetical protein CL441_08790 [Acidimicrobiaceae bacterium]|jgi:hypothetical protein|nr:hypothetical protein [Acidimicrobiaceae bacterium]
MTTAEALDLAMTISDDGLVTLAEVGPAAEGFVGCLRALGVDAGDPVLDGEARHYTVPFPASRYWFEAQSLQDDWSFCESRHLGVMTLTEPGAATTDMHEVRQACQARIVDASVVRHGIGANLDWMCSNEAARTCGQSTVGRPPVCSVESTGE